ncbi:hypothetical protein ACV3OB_15915 [Clostridium perfringens]|nr:hypothetical protein [Clostridium perfringens]
MDKLKVTDLEIGKVYKGSNGYLYKISETHYNDELELLSKGKEESEWGKSCLSANEFMRMKFTEVSKEIDWAKVPFGTKVIVTDHKEELNEDCGEYVMFVGYNPKLETYPFIVTHSEKDYVSSYAYCMIDPSQEIKEEWYK